MGGLCTGRRSDARLATFLVVRRPSIVVSDDGKPAKAALGTLLTVEEVSLALRASQELRSRSHEFRVLGFWDSARKKFVHDKVFRKRCMTDLCSALPTARNFLLHPVRLPEASGQQRLSRKSERLSQLLKLSGRQTCVHRRSRDQAS